MAKALFPAIFAEAMKHDPAATGDGWKQDLCYDVWRWADIMLDVQSIVPAEWGPG